MKVIQIVPRLTPPAEGVGSFAQALAEALSGFGVETRFVSGEAARTAQSPAKTLLDTLESGENAPVLLHYAGYGYQSRGCPVWLVEGVSRWLRRGDGRRGIGTRRLATVFHEVWATGPPWRSSFWLAPVQQRLAAALVRLSTDVVTSLDLYGRMVRPWSAGRTIRIMPVFSTVGEPAALPPFAARSPRLVLFGGAGVRARAWGPERPALAAACEALGIEEILDVGPPAPTPRSLGAVPVRALGSLSTAEVGALLLDCRAGFVSYPPGFLPKSTIFAAYCSHGLLPVCAWGRRSPDAGPLPPFWRPGTADDPQETAARAHAWYAGHALSRQAQVYRDLLTRREVPA